MTVLRSNLVNTAGICLSLSLPVSLTTYLLELRLTPLALLGVAMVQAYLCWVHFTRRNFLLAVFGSSLTLVLLVAAAVGLGPEFVFSSIETRAVYTPRILSAADSSLVLGTSVFHLLALALAPIKPWAWPPPDLSEHSVAIISLGFFLVTAIVCLSLTAQGELITQAQYASPKQGRAVVQSSGLKLVGLYCLVGSLIAGVRVRPFSSKSFWLLSTLVVFLLIYFQLLRGERSGAIGVLLVWILLAYVHIRSPELRKRLAIAMSVVVLILLMQLWGGLRQLAYATDWWAAVGLAWERSASVFRDGESLGFNLQGVSFVTQPYWHLLHTVDLYSLGNQLDGQSFAHLIGQSVPAFVADLIGYERPPNGAIRLARHRVHGGGMFVLALGYWNLGLVGVGIVATALGAGLSALERLARKQRPLVWVGYFMALSMFVEGVFYGWQSLAKSLQVAAAFSVLVVIGLGSYRQVCRRRSGETVRG